jgi:hypothetical protein
MTSAVADKKMRHLPETKLTRRSRTVSMKHRITSDSRPFTDYELPEPQSTQLNIEASIHWAECVTAMS